MDAILNYLKENPRYVVIFFVTLFACAVAIAAIILIRKSITKMQIENIKKLEQLEKDEQANKQQEQSDLNNLQTDSKKVEEKTPSNPSNSAVISDENATTSVFTQPKPVNPAPSVNFESKGAEKKVDSKENAKKIEVEEKPEDVKYAGKWLIYKENDRYFADLKASNGEVMLSSEGYTSLSGIKSGIETLKKNIASENYAINLDKNGNYVFKIFSTANRLLCVGEGYSSKDQCEKAFASVKRFSKTAVIVNPNEKDN